ncbi:MAG: ABC transporter ATP-binding protein [Saprospiraceae bacterium]
MISIKNLYKSFGKNEVLKGIDIDFNASGITAVLGPNGSGKTTLIKSVLGMVIPNRGEILVNGKSIKKHWEYRSQIDYLPQIARFPENLKVNDLITMIKDLRSQPSDEQTFITNFGLEPFLDKRLGTLSGGTKQKVNLLLAFMYDNPILILDEPTNGLDPVALIRLKDLVRAERAKGKTILMTTHIMSLVEELADEIVFLLEGKVYFRGKVQALLEAQGEANLERAIAKMLTGKEEIATLVPSNSFD